MLLVDRIQASQRTCSPWSESFDSFLETSVVSVLRWPAYHPRRLSTCFARREWCCFSAILLRSGARNYALVLKSAGARSNQSGSAVTCDVEPSLDCTWLQMWYVQESALLKTTSARVL